MNIYKSKKGYLCAEKDGKNIHSKYDPLKEAKRFVENSINEKKDLIIFLGAGLGYIQNELINQFPNSQILAVYYDSSLYENCIYKNHKIKIWDPSSKISIENFFNLHIEEQHLRDVTVIEWNPSSLIFEEFSLKVNQSLKIVIQQLNGNIKTTAAFGKKWIRNMIVNYLSIDSYCSFNFTQSPIVIASSGPSLEKSIEKLIKYRKKYILWALPSSLMALEYYGIKADLVITTDPGYYGTVHLHHLSPEIPVALPLTASRGLWHRGNSAIVLNQDFPFEKDLFKMLEIENKQIPSNGTVSGTALELALGNNNDVYFAGLDLCYKDIQSHIRPHSFDNLLQCETKRINPGLNVIFNRASNTKAHFDQEIRTSQSLDTYANWFNEKMKGSTISIKRVQPSPVQINNMEKGDLDNLSQLNDVKKQLTTVYPAEKKVVRRKNVENLLTFWLEGLKNSSRQDLQYFIDTDAFSKKESSIKSQEFVSELRGIYG